MATGGTPSGKSFIFDVPSQARGGGYATYAPSGYAAAYAQGKGIMEMIDWQDKKRREAIEEQYAQSREQRAMESERLAQERADREQARLELQSRRQEAYEARKQAREDQYANRMDDLDKIVGAINEIDPIHKDATKMLNDVRSSQEFHRLMANRDTRQSLNDAWKAKTGEIKDIIGGIQHEAQTKYGVEADMAKFPVDEYGNWDFQKGYNEHLPSIAQEMQQKAQQTYEMAQAPQGKVKYAEYDEYGRPVVKFAQEPAMGAEERVQVASDLGLVPSGISAGGQVTYSRPKEQKKSGLEILSGTSTPSPTPLPSLTTEATNDASPSPAPMPLGDIFK
jgi:hypothetical protein